jgi:hypothetical protein
LRRRDGVDVPGNILRKRHPQLRIGVRAFDGRTAIYPPEAWQPNRVARRRGPIAKRIAKTMPIAAALENMMPRLAGATLAVRSLSPRGEAAHFREARIARFAQLHFS